MVLLLESAMVTREGWGALASGAIVKPMRGARVFRLRLPCAFARQTSLKMTNKKD
jgi:hypothetical protein